MQDDVKAVEAGMMNFAPRPGVAWSDQFEAALDAAIKAKREADDAAYKASDPNAMRPAIGAGRLGNECLRAIAYEFHRTPKDPERAPSGRLYRIFDRGHMAEEKMAEYLRLMGLTVATTNKFGKQFRFDILRYDDGKGRVKGMIDGVITAVPPELTYQLGIKAACVWENKELGSKSWTKLKKSGLKGYGGDYYFQAQVNMAYLELTENPALFTAKNADTQEVYAELVAFDQSAAQKGSDVGARVASSLSADEFPRLSNDPTHFKCRFCDYAETCHRAAQPAQAPAQPWSWGANNAH